jgi:hypothetical protein
MNARCPRASSVPFAAAATALACVPNRRRDQAASNIGPPTARAGFEWAEGGECTCENGDDGLYVRQGDQLICRPRDFNGDARTVDVNAAERRRADAYFASVRDAENEWRKW